MTCVKSQCGVT